jgi:3-oxoacyl-[acyl-carrier-protein] synthase II
VPPTLNLVDPDPAAAGLRIVHGEAARQEISVALSNSFGFGGQNTALVFTRWTS